MIIINQYFMALIKCEECGKEISDKAAFCPSCGKPSNMNENKKTVEIELTSKKWKRKFLWGIAFYFIGWAMLYKVTGLGVLLMFVGFIIVIRAAIGRWWTNG